MTLAKCTECGVTLRSKRHARNHYQKRHSGEIETPEEYLTRIESEQRDFHGEPPDDSDHNPEYEVTNDPPDTSKTTLFEHERENDDSLTEYTEGTGE